MVDWLLSKLGLMRVSRHKEIEDDIYSGCDVDMQIVKEQIDWQRELDADEAAKAIRLINAIHAEKIARLQREVDYWCKECFLARGAK